VEDGHVIGLGAVEIELLSDTVEFAHKDIL
jgi:hypothetical protein